MKKIYHSTIIPHCTVKCSMVLSYLIICDSALCAFSCKAQIQQRYFESVCGKEKSMITWKEKTDNNIIFLTTSQNSEIHHYRLSPSCTTLSWQLTDSIKHTNLTVILYNNIYYFKGVFNNRPYSKSVKSKGYPWYQNIAYSAGQTVNKNSIKYECFRPDNLELYVMQAERKAGTVVFNNQKAYEVKVKLTGLLSHFWSCLYYFNAANHQFIGYKGVNGGPGTPETIIKAK